MSDCDVCIGVGDGERCDVYVAENRKARKQYECCECKRQIKSGEVYENVKMLYGGAFDEIKTCLLCAEIGKVFSCGEGRVHSMLWEDMADYAFPKLTTASPCFAELSPAAKQFVLDRWNVWKFGHARP